MGEDGILAPYREQAVICLLEDAVQLIEAHAKLHEKGGVEQGGMDSGNIEEIEEEDKNDGAEGVAESL